VEDVLQVPPGLLRLPLDHPSRVDGFLLEDAAEFLAEADELAGEVEHPIGLAFIDKYFFFEGIDVPLEFYFLYFPFFPQLPDLVDLELRIVRRIKIFIFCMFVFIGFQSLAVLDL